MRNRDEPIQNAPAEQAALGCALMDSNLVHRLDPGLFYDIRHQALVVELQAMFKAGKLIDPSTVTAHVAAVGKEGEVGGSLYLSLLPDKSPSPAAFSQYLGDLQDFALRRKQVVEAETLAEGARDLSKPALEHQADAETRLLKLRAEGSTVRKSNGQILAEINREVEEAIENPGVFRGVATGLKGIDRRLGGLLPGQLVFIGARPGQGKSALLMQIAANVAATGKSVGHFSLEMSAKELLTRLACSKAKVDSSLLKEGLVSESEQGRFIDASKALARIPLVIEDRNVGTVDLIAAKARQMIVETGLKLLVIDYVQLMQSSNRKASRYEVVTEVTAALKQLAMDLEIPIIAGAQLNRDVEKDARKPRLSDLRDSGSIEQDGDIVLLIHSKPEDIVQHGVAVDLLIAKQRGGWTGPVGLIFNKTLTTFEDRSPVAEAFTRQPKHLNSRAV